MESAQVGWTTSDADVASVSTRGLVTATGNGTATVTATSGEASESAPVTVAQAAMTVRLFPGPDTLFSAGDTTRLTAIPEDRNGNVVPDLPVSWTSSDSAVVLVDSSGLATAAGPNGEATITATADGSVGRAVVSVVTGPQGGSVIAAEGAVTLEVPEGAVQAPISISVQPMGTYPDPERVVTGTAFEFGPDGITFAQPVTLSITYDPANLPTGVLESRLRLAELIDGAYEAVDASAVDESSHAVSGKISGFSTYVLAAPEADLVPDGTKMSDLFCHMSGGIESSARVGNWMWWRPDISDMNPQPETVADWLNGYPLQPINVIWIDHTAINKEMAQNHVAEYLADADFKLEIYFHTVDYYAWYSGDGYWLPQWPVGQTWVDTTWPHANNHGRVFTTENVGTAEKPVFITFGGFSAEGEALTKKPHKFISFKAAQQAVLGGTLDHPAIPGTGTFGSWTYARFDRERGSVLGEKTTKDHEGVAVLVLPGADEGPEILPGKCESVIPPPPPPPPCHSCGDVHVRTPDGLHYDFQGAGEYLLTASSDGEVVVQTRQQPWRGSRFVSVNTAVAMDVSGDRVGVYLDRSPGLFLNGDPSALETGSLALPHGGRVYRLASSRTEYLVEWPNGFLVAAKIGASYIDVGVAKPPALQTAFGGILGNLNGIAEDDAFTRDGTVLPLRIAYQTLYHTFGDSWRIDQAESLFDYDPGTSTATFTLLDFPQGPFTARHLDPADYEAARFVCEAAGITDPILLEDCILDVAATGDTEFTESGVDSAEPRISLEVQLALNLGDLVSASIDEAGEVDLFPFTGTAGDIISIALAQTVGFDSFHGVLAQARLVSPTGDTLSVWNANSQPEFTLPTSGTYAVVVRASNLTATGDYSLGLEGVSPVSPDRVSIAIGDLKTDQTISAAAEVDEFVFTGTAGDIVSIALAQTAGFDSFHGVLAQARLFSPAGVEVSAWNANNQPEFTLEETGTYLIQVQASNYVYTGTYSLGLEGVLPLSPDRVSIALGDLEQDQTIGAAADVDEFVFTGTAGDIVSIALAQTAGFDSFHGVLAQARLFSPAGVEISAWNANNQPEFTLEETGTYLIQVQASNYVYAGTYSLGLEGVLPLSPDRVSIALGDLEQDQTIGAAADVDEFVFTGTAGDIVSIALAQTAGFDSFHGVLAQARLFSPTGVEISAWNANNQPEFTLEETGTYLIQVQASNYVYAGTYSLGLEGVSPLSPDAQTLTAGAPLSRTIGAAADVDEFVFMGSAGDIVSIALAQTAGFDSFHGVLAQARLFSPAGVEVSAWNANNQPEFTLAETGTYLIQVQASDYVHTGSYDIGLVIP